MNNVVRKCRHGHFAWKLLITTTGTPLVLGALITAAQATAPCDDFDECKVLVEINATDGDVGFHWLGDADDQRSTRIDDPNGQKIWQDNASGALREQTKTENFGESGEPLCWEDPEADEDEEIVTLEEFVERWAPGTYVFTGKGDGGEMLTGETVLTYFLPAAPTNLDFNGNVISWEEGDDLGVCGDNDTLADLVTNGVLPVHPADVPIRAWEVVLEPDVEDDPVEELRFTVRVPFGIDTVAGVTVSSEYLASLPNDTPAKIEVGAIGGDFDGSGDIDDDDNATFTEVVGLCINEDEGCEEEEE